MSRLGRIVLVYFTLAILVCLEVQAEEPSQDNHIKVLVIKVGMEPEAKAQEVRFIDELRLVLDAFEVQVINTPVTDFREDTFGNQIIYVKSIIHEEGAIAGIWLSPASKDLLLLHMVVAKTSRTIVRMIEIESKVGFETDLALYARESLGEAFLLSETKEMPEISEVVDEVMRQAAEPEKIGPPEIPSQGTRTASPKWSMVLTPVIEGNITGGYGPPILMGGSMALNFGVTQGFGLRTGFAVIGGPLGTAGQGEVISRLSLIPGASAYYMWEFEKISLGPSVDVQGLYTNLSIAINQTTSTSSAHWRFRLGANIEANLSISKHVSFFTALGVTLLPLTDTYFGGSSGDLYYATPRLGWRSLIGLNLHP